MLTPVPRHQPFIQDHDDESDDRAGEFAILERVGLIAGDHQRAAQMKSPLATCLAEEYVTNLESPGMPALRLALSTPLALRWSLRSVRSQYPSEPEGEDLPAREREQGR